MRGLSLNTSFALKVEPKNVYAHFNLGQSYLAEDRLPEALAHFLEAHRQSPDNATLCFLVGKVNERIGQRVEAVRFYKEAIRIRPDYAEAKSSLAALE
jgi:tetratricopeptide (TPR) repeat protein